MAGIVHRLRCIGAALLSVLLLVRSGLTEAQAPPQGLPASSSIDPFYGAFGTTVPIGVPVFRGLEPSLHLVYSSSNGNGLAGVGWGLSGFSTVERASPGRGVPLYSASDRFLLDGQELVDCTAGTSSPSCTTGGTHATRIESYQRVRFDAAANIWTVWRKDGTSLRYIPIFPAHRGATLLGTYRWGLSSVTETRGNVVSYTWWCDGTPVLECYPDTISYGAYRITLFREPRPEAVTFAYGASSLGSTRYRIRSILVTGPDSAPIRAYRLTYNQSASTSRSLLSSVEQYGRDVVIDSTGVISSGSALPRATYSWQAGARGFLTTLASPVLDWGYETGRDWVDFNGDGRADYCRRVGGTSGTLGSVSCTMSTGAGFGATYGSGVLDWGYEAGRAWVDFNGDGKADFCRVVGNTNGVSSAVSCTVSTGTGFGATYSSSVLDWGYETGRAWVDFNGDGKADFCRRVGNSSNTIGWISCTVSTGAGFGSTYASPALDWGYEAGRAWVDFNGDGKADFCRVVGTTNGVSSAVSCTMSTGAGFGATYASSVLDWGHETGRAWVDFNGDGKPDYCRRVGATNGVSSGIACTLSNGAGFEATHRSGTVDWGYDTGWSWVDFNGDGRTDYCRRVGNVNGVSSAVSCTVSTGTGFGATYGSGILDWGYDAGRSWTDFDGDGKADFCRAVGNVNSVSSAVSCNRSAGPAPDLLASLSNGLGGTSTIQYQPSSAWSNVYLPAILQTAAAITNSDGRGASSTTSYLYQGGLFSVGERRFLGFRRITAVLDGAGNYIETYYHQGEGCIGKPETTYLRDSVGRIYSYSAHTYSENTTLPYTSLLTQRWDYECNLTASCRRVLTQFGYDQYANAILTKEYGDYDVSGDEKTTVRSFVPNTSAYVVAARAYENTYAGIGTAGTLLQQTLYAYDGAASYVTAPTAGRLTQTQTWNSVNGGYLTTRYAYDAWGNQISITNPLGITTSTVAYDDGLHLFPVRRCDALGHCLTRAWDTGLGLETSQIDINGTVTTTIYDVFGRPLSESKAGRTVQYSYLSPGDPNNQRVRQILSDGTADGLWQETYYDGLSRVFLIVKKGGARQETRYNDGSTRPWQQSAWYGDGEMPRYQVRAYDGVGRLQSVTHPDGSQAQISYGPGYVAFKDELGREKISWLDPQGRVTQIREKVGASYFFTSFTLDPLGRVLRSANAAGHIATYAYNSLGWKMSECDPDVGCLAYTYDGAGNLATQRNARGEVITYTYDGAGRRTSRKWPNASRTRWTYDETGHGLSLGLLTTVVDPSGSESLSYDSLGRVTATTKCVRGACYTLAHAYDALGRIAALTYPDGEVLSYSYDGTGQLTAVSGYVQSMVYNARGQLMSVRYANGTVNTYTYDDARQWLRTATVTGPSGTLYHSSYTYDAAAQVTGVASTTNALLNLSFAYDDLGRLTRVSGGQSQSFSYDSIGNITASSELGSYAYGELAHPHAVTAAGGQTYTYDMAGNMLSGAGRIFTWNYDNRITSVGNSSGTTRFEYDYSGRRVYRSGPSGTTSYFGAFLEVRDGTLVKNYYAGPHLVTTRDSLGARWYHTDHLGSIRLATSTAGAVIERYDYAAFGNTVQALGSGSRRFAGHRRDPETGLLYMGARYYDPILGRFLSADSVLPDPDNPQALNRYSYAFNNPISNRDPTGHAPLAVAQAMGMVTAFVQGQLGALSLYAFITTTAGHLLKDPMLISIGSVMMGYATGGPWGTVIAAVESPVSPLHPRVKQAIGWAWTIYGLTGDNPEPEMMDDSACYQPISSPTGDVVIRMVNGTAYVQATGILTSHNGAPLWDRLKRDIANLTGNLVGELGPSGRWIEEQLRDRGIGPDQIRYTGHSMGAWTGLTLARKGVVQAGNVLAMALPLPAIAQLTEIGAQGMGLSVILGASDPVSGMIFSRGAGLSALQRIGVSVKLIDTGAYSIGAHNFLRYCAAVPGLCQ